MKNQKGITLVALVITIIVLLILAGVSISLVVGQNGVLGKAQSAVESQKKAEVTQAITLAINSCDATWGSEWATNQSITRATVYERDLATEISTQGYTLTGTIKADGTENTWTLAKGTAESYSVKLKLSDKGEVSDLAITITK